MKSTIFLLLVLLISPLKAQNVPTFIPTDGLIAWYPFNGNANDESGNGNTITNNTASLVADRNSVEKSAYGFDGSQYMSFETSDSYSNLVNGFSVSLWFYLNSGYNNNPRMFYIGQTDQNRKGIHLLIERNGNIGYSVQPGGVSPCCLGSWSGVESATASTDSWHHVLFSTDFNSGEARLYLDGLLVHDMDTSKVTAEVLNALKGISYNSLSGNIGQKTGGNDKYNGKLDDIAIWKRALTQDEVLKIYNQSGPESIYAGKVKNNTDSGESLFFSEFITGTGLNKAFEIFNPFDDPVDLSNYLVLGNTNGGAFNDTLSFPSGTILDPQEVYVVAHSESMPEILTVADTLLNTNMISFDGNDTRVLVRIDEGDLILLDVFGSVYDSPEIGWTTYGVENATATHTIFRKNFVGRGNPNGLDAFGAEEPWIPYITGEWYVSAPNDIGSIGFHNYLNIPSPEENILLNGNFELSDSIRSTGSDSFTYPLSGIGNTVSGTVDLNPWFSEHAQDRSIVSTISIQNGELAFKDLDGSRHPYDTQAGQYINSSQLTKGKKYEISFDAYSSEEQHGIHVFLGQVGKGWTRYMESAFPSYNATGDNIGSGDVFLNTLKQNYSLVFQADTVWSVMRLSFEVDTKPGDVYIDNVILKQVSDDTPITMANPIRINPPLVRIDTIHTIGPEFTLSVSTDGIASDLNVESFNFTLNYPKELSFEDYITSETLANNGIIEVNSNETSLHVGFASNNLISGNDPLIKLKFSSMTGADYPISLTDVVFNNVVTNNYKNGLIGVIGSLGDVDNDGSVFAFDAAKVLKYSTGLDPIPDEDPLPWDFWRLGAADVDSDGEILASDASDILKYSVGLINEFAPSVKGKLSVPQIDMYASDKELRIETDGNGLFAMNLEFAIQEGMSFGEPTSTENVLLASNMQDSLYRIAVASSADLTGNFLTVPINNLVGDEVITIEYFLNNIKGQRNVDMNSWLTANEGVPNNPQSFELLQNYPNPFNPMTSIQYALPEDTQVSLVVFNALGQKVLELVNGQKSAGYHIANFDASGLSSGVYLYKLTTPSFTDTKKMLLIK